MLGPLGYLHRMTEKRVRPEALLAVWRERAKGFRALSMSADAATLVEHLALELEQALRYEGEDILTIAEAAEIVGRSAGHLRDLISAKRIPNAGRRDAPR